MRVLIGIDGSIASRAAIAWGIERAREGGGDVTLLFVVDDEWGTVGASGLAELRSSAATLIEHELVSARAIADAVPVHAEVAVGAPMLTLAIEAKDYAVVVIGTHKVGVFNGLALGSRALQLAALSPVPVAVVPAQSGGQRTGIIVGIGGEAGEDVVVRAAAAESIRTDEPLVLVRSFAHSAAAGEWPLDRATRLAESLVSPAGVSQQRSGAAPGEALAVMSGEAVLTVVGRPTAAGAHGYRPLGRASADLLMNLRGPALIVPFQNGHERAGGEV
ncbi:universal stress protein [Agromyces protaetiae]|uniref:universal stress protein n=1 Tax=Agromyces protaetiae TaxID=2509455 RepID=UPI0013EE3EA5|nr:universal stress protein [Agromyces protaetiae]